MAALQVRVEGRVHENNDAETILGKLKVFFRAPTEASTINMI